MGRERERGNSVNINTLLYRTVYIRVENSEYIINSTHNVKIDLNK